MNTTVTSNPYNRHQYKGDTNIDIHFNAFDSFALRHIPVSPNATLKTQNRPIQYPYRLNIVRNAKILKMRQRRFNPQKYIRKMIK